MDESVQIVRKMKKTDSKPARHKLGNAVMAMSAFADGGSPAATQATVVSIESHERNAPPAGGMSMDANAVKHVLEERRRLDEKLRKQREEVSFCGERSDELKTRRLLSLIGCASSYRLVVDATIIAAHFQVANVHLPATCYARRSLKS